MPIVACALSAFCKAVREPPTPPGGAAPPPTLPPARTVAPPGVTAPRRGSDVPPEHTPSSLHGTEVMGLGAA
eukprot:2472864-Prymnesium_polylepis.1